MKKLLTALCSLALLLAAPALLPEGGARAATPGTLAKTPYGYRWSRNGLGVDLRDRGSRWSPEHAAEMKAAFDLLPDVLLRRAFVDIQVKTFYRDPIPVGRGDVPRKHASATTVIEQGWIAIGDAVFAKGCYEVVTHELGHCAQYALAGKGPVLSRIQTVALGTPGFTNISWTFAVTDGLRSWNGFVSDYARTDDREDFAESVEFYWLAPDELRRVSPAKYRFMRDVVFGGEVSPPEARVEGKAALDHVVPEVRRLGDTRDDALSLVQVHGERFMGPLDGGYNRVRYRGTGALHLSVSRKTIYSWVPPIALGRAPITVTTQDGRSNEAEFTVTKPWWRFW